jgi:acyl carrier protein
MNNLEREIIDAIAELNGIDREKIKSDSVLSSLGIDSLSALEILVALEEKYDIEIPDNELKNVNSITEIISIVSRNLDRKKAGNS